MTALSARAGEHDLVNLVAGVACTCGAGNLDWKHRCHWWAVLDSNQRPKDYEWEAQDIPDVAGGSLRLNFQRVLVVNASRPSEPVQERIAWSGTRWGSDRHAQ